MREKDILLRFIDRKILRGRYTREVPINRLNKEGRDTHGFFWRIDATCRDAFNRLYLIEVKKELNRELLGQILADSFFVKEKHRRVVVVDEADERMKELFHHYDVEVFVV